MRCDEVVGVLNQFFLGERIDQLRDAGRAGESKRETANAFNERVCALQKHAYLEKTVDAMLVHVRFMVTSNTAGVLNV